MENKFTILDLNQVNHEIQWCPGCGDFGILFAIKKAIFNLNINPKDVVVVSGIGCSGKTPHYIKTYGIETLHGRTLPVASAIKLANKKLHVIVVGGDGDGYGIGMGHFIHTVRRNVNITYLVHNNETYGLTKGQASPTTKKGTKTSSTPNGSQETPINPLALSILNGATFVAKGYAGNMINLAELISKGIQNQGFSHIDIIQACPSYNKSSTNENLNKIVSYLDENFDYSDRKNSLLKVMDEKNKYTVGIYYQENLISNYDNFSDLENSRIEDDIENINLGKGYKYFI